MEIQFVHRLVTVVTGEFSPAAPELDEPISPMLKEYDFAAAAKVLPPITTCCRVLLWHIHADANAVSSLEGLVFQNCRVAEPQQRPKQGFTKCKPWIAI